MRFNTQREATFHAVTTVFNENGIKFVPGKTDAGTIVTRGSEIRKLIIAFLVSIFESKEAPLARGQTDLPKYCSGLLNNWMRRDPQLNGGKEYHPDVGSADEQIRAMTKLLSVHPEASAEINAAIEKRRQEVVAARKTAKVKEVDISKLPQDLVKKLKLG